MRHLEPTLSYVERRTAEVKAKREGIRCLKRYVPREVFRNLPTPDSLRTPELLLDAALQRRNIERFHRILLEEWAYIRAWSTETSRLAHNEHFVHSYNHWRGYGTLG